MTDTIRWGPGRRAAFIDWARYEIQRVRSARSSLEKLWRIYQELYRAPEPKAIRQFPFEGASNRTYPLAKMTLDPILARYLRTLHAPLNVYTLEALNERWVPVAKPLQDYLQFLDHKMLGLWDVNYRVLDEMLKLGTGIYKVGWRYENHRVTGYDQNLNRTSLIRQINQPVVDHVPLSHFLVPPESLNIDADAQGGAQWVGERLRFR